MHGTNIIHVLKCFLAFDRLSEFVFTVVSVIPVFDLLFVCAKFGV